MTSINLLAGPRGRRFCLDTVTALSGDLWSRHLEAAWEPGNPGLLGKFSAAVASEASLAAVSRLSADDLLTALSLAVDHAAYWQPPADVDGLAQSPEVLQALEPIAQALADRIGRSWWDSPLDSGTQRSVQWIDEHDLPAPWLTGAAGRLAVWRERTVASERLASRWPRSLKRRPASSWWSTPALSQLVTTSRGLPGLGAAGLGGPRAEPPPGGHADEAEDGL